jgi:hypothetical protein
MPDRLSAVANEQAGNQDDGITSQNVGAHK